jgi:hypothetical protein
MPKEKEESEKDPSSKDHVIRSFRIRYRDVPDVQTKLGYIYQLEALKNELEALKNELEGADRPDRVTIERQRTFEKLHGTALATTESRRTAAVTFIQDKLDHQLVKDLKDKRLDFPDLFSQLTLIAPVPLFDEITIFESNYLFICVDRETNGPFCLQKQFALLYKFYTDALKDNFSVGEIASRNWYIPPALRRAPPEPADDKSKALVDHYNNMVKALIAIPLPSYGYDLKDFCKNIFVPNAKRPLVLTLSSDENKTLGIRKAFSAAPTETPVKIKYYTIERRKISALTDAECSFDTTDPYITILASTQNYRYQEKKDEIRCDDHNIINETYKEMCLSVPRLKMSWFCPETIRYLDTKLAEYIAKTYPQDPPPPKDSSLPPPSTVNQTPPITTENNREGDDHHSMNAYDRFQSYAFGDLQLPSQQLEAKVEVESLQEANFFDLSVRILESGNYGGYIEALNQGFEGQLTDRFRFHGAHLVHRHQKLRDLVNPTSELALYVGGFDSRISIFENVELHQPIRELIYALARESQEAEMAEQEAEAETELAGLKLLPNPVANEPRVLVPNNMLSLQDWVLARKQQLSVMGSNDQTGQLRVLLTFNDREFRLVIGNDTQWKANNGELYLVLNVDSPSLSLLQEALQKPVILTLTAIKGQAPTVVGSVDNIGDDHIAIRFDLPSNVRAIDLYGFIESIAINQVGQE